MDKIVFLNNYLDLIPQFFNTIDKKYFGELYKQCNEKKVCQKSNVNNVVNLDGRLTLNINNKKIKKNIILEDIDEIKSEIAFKWNQFSNQKDFIDYLISKIDKEIKYINKKDIDKFKISFNEIKELVEVIIKIVIKNTSLVEEKEIQDNQKNIMNKFNKFNEKLLCFFVNFQSELNQYNDLKKMHLEKTQLFFNFENKLHGSIPLFYYMALVKEILSCYYVNRDEIQIFLSLEESLLKWAQMKLI